MMRLNRKQYMSVVQSLGCYCCQNDGHGCTPAQLHHPRAKAGMSERADDFDVIPLCINHHLGPIDAQHSSYPGGGAVVSVHKNKKRFTEIYGDEYTIVANVRLMVEECLKSSSIGRVNKPRG